MADGGTDVMSVRGTWKGKCSQRIATVVWGYNWELCLCIS